MLIFTELNHHFFFKFEFGKRSTHDWQIYKYECDSKWKNPIFLFA